MRLALIGVPYTSSGRADGEARSPTVLRAAGLLTALRDAVNVVDVGDVSVPSAAPHRDPLTGMIAPNSLVGMIDAVRDSVGGALEQQRLPLVVGGECPLLLGCLEAPRDAFGRVGLLFADGHEDAWSPHGSTTGEAADMELGLALGVTALTGLPDLASRLPLIQPDDAVVLGPRDREELETAGQPSLASSVVFLDDVTLRESDIDATVRTVARAVHDRTPQWWFHLDLDVLSTEAMPAVRYPQPGGLSWSDLEVLTAAALCMPGLAGWDVTIYNPDLDPDGAGADRIVEFIGAMTRYLA